MPVTLSVVMVNYNGGAMLRNSVLSIPAALTGDFTLESVFVVDNASSDASLSLLEALHPSDTSAAENGGEQGQKLPLTIIRNKENEGFGAACNKGARLASSDYILFLNPDTALYRDSLSVPLGILQNGADTGVGICSVQLIDERGKVSRTCARFLKPRYCVFRAFNLGKLFPGRFTTHFMREWNHGSSAIVDHVMGAFLLMKRSVFEELGGFDERFFVYLEDMDFQKRAKERGFLSYYSADAKAFHKGGGSSEKVKARRLFYSLQSRIKYAWKHFSKPSAIASGFFTLTVEFLTRLLYALLRLRFKEMGETLSGYGRLYLWIITFGRIG